MELGLNLAFSTARLWLSASLLTNKTSGSLFNDFGTLFCILANKRSFPCDFDNTVSRGHLTHCPPPQKNEIFKFKSKKSWRFSSDKILTMQGSPPPPTTTKVTSTKIFDGSHK